MADQLGDTLRVTFRGSMVECLSLEDAMAVRAAETMLTNGGACDESPAGIERITDVLVSYGRVDEAKTLRHLAARIRAMQFLVGSVGYSHRPRV